MEQLPDAHSHVCIWREKKVNAFLLFFSRPCYHKTCTISIAGTLAEDEQSEQEPRDNVFPLSGNV